MMLLDEPRLICDQDSVLRVKVGNLAALTKRWGSFEAGDVFYVLDTVECNGGQYVRWNARVVELSVHERGMTEDSFFRRTVPAEYLRWVPAAGDGFSVDRNQGNRDAVCIARIGKQALCDYEMPAGRVFLFIMDGLGERSVSRKQLPSKWREFVDED